jgi:hypothetical protein
MASSASYRFTPNRAGQDRLLNDPAGPYGQWLTRVLNEAANEARQRANVDTGYMRSRIEFVVQTGPDGTLEGILAARTDYALYVHEKYNPFLQDAINAVLARY